MIAALAHHAHYSANDGELLIGGLVLLFILTRRRGGSSR